MNVAVNSVAIVDYQLCNLDSITRAVEECGGRPLVTQDPRDLGKADRIILPGVGSFDRAMQNLRSDGLDKAMVDAVLGSDVPLLGICLGMQLLADRGTEGGDCAGLAILRGTGVRLDPRQNGATPGQPVERVPHMGWNDVGAVKASPLFEGVPDHSDFYFVHGYRLDSPPDQVIGTVDYCGKTVAVAGRDHVFAVQFHPEKSQTMGFRLLSNFLAY